MLEPYVARGDIVIVHEDWAEDWKPENAKRIVNAAISAGGADIDAVLASNDGTAGGAIQALSEEGLAGKVLVTGQDAEIVALQRIAAGTQTMTIYKPLQTLARGAAELAVRMAKRQVVVARQTVDNGYGPIPAALYDVVTVTRDNIVATVVRDGQASYDDVYRGIPEGPAPAAPMSSAPVLEAQRIVKRFGGLAALDGVSFDLRRGEVHALCGENGAGKSTLIKLLAGVHPHGSYEGEILIDGRPATFRSTRDAERAGIAIIHQELALFPEMSVGENLFLGALADPPRAHRLGPGLCALRGHAG